MLNSNSSQIQEKAKLEQKDVIIAQLKAENFELRNKEKEMQVIQSEIAELEHKIELYSQEKSQKQKMYLRDEDTLQKKIEQLKIESNKLNENLNEKNRVNKSLTSDVHSIKDMLDYREIEISKFSNEEGELESHHCKLASQIESLHTELNIITDGKKSALQELHNMQISNENTKTKIANQKNKIREAEADIAQQKNALAKESRQLSEIKDQNKKLDQSLQAVKEVRNSTLSQIQSQTNAKQLLLSDKSAQKALIESKQNAISKLENKYKDLLDSLMQKDNEIKDVTALIAKEEQKNLILKSSVESSTQDIMRTEEILKNCRNLSEQIKLSKIKMIEENMELASNKQVVESKYHEKEDSIRAAKCMIQSLLEDCNQLSRENKDGYNQIDALKEHLEVLQNQNDCLNSELDNIVATDEQIKKDLNRNIQYESTKHKSKMQN